MSISAIASSTAAVTTSPSTAYSDGTSEVETSASTPGGQGNQSGQTYNAQGAWRQHHNTTSTSGATAGV